MFCSHCGSEIQSQSKFCNQCGLETSSSGKQPLAHASPVRKSSNLLWLFPINCLLLVVVAAALLYHYHDQIDQEVAGLLEQAEALALSDQLSESLKALEAALAKRPTHPTLLASHSLLQDAITLKRSVLATSDQIKQQQFDEAMTVIDSVKKQMNTRSGPIYDQLLGTINSREETIVIARTNAELMTIETVKDLIPLLHHLRTYESEEAKVVKADIINKATGLAQASASQQLKSRDFSKALTTVNEALSLEKDHTELIALKATIEKEKSAYEDAEQKRIQQAMEAAAQEDLLNRTHAVELVELEVYNDNYGYFHVEGTVKNVATRPLSTILVFYDLYDEWGNYLREDSVYVSPYYVEVGGTATFSSQYYNYQYMERANVTSFEWVLN